MADTTEQELLMLVANADASDDPAPNSVRNQEAVP